MAERCEAVFWDSTNGYFTVICRGFFKRDRKPGCLFPTVEEAKEELASNATYIGLN